MSAAPARAARAADAAPAVALLLEVDREYRDKAAGRRVVRGREEECRAHYERTTQGEHA